MNLNPRLLIVLVAVALGACSSDDLLLQRKVDYRSGSDNVSKNNLEVPPDLTAPANTAGYSMPSRTVVGEAPAPVVKSASATAEQPVVTETAVNAKARLVQAGGQRWLVVQGDPAKIWPEIREFWLDNGFLLAIDNPSIGVMETDWLENRANLPQDWVTKLLRKVADQFISTGELDKFRTRIEPGATPGTTEIYVSHRGMTEVFADGSTEAKVSTTSNETKTVWTPRPTDPELEAEMLALMLQRLGMTEQQAQAVVNPPKQTKARATLVDNNTALNIDDAFDRAWRRVGLALDRVGYVVYDRDRSKGVYFVRRAEADIGEEKKSSFWSSIGFGNGDKQEKVKVLPEYEIHVAQQVNGTRLTVTGKDGTTADAESQAKLLSALQSQLR
ncbi:outer membrane protein assembly factor BamC [Chitiniphilus eburneus]|uniref:Outer membrane protein assembly factor BamC n=1 Tax=Chitiniphilus eburneus TaxID=2571148 RepID=A0A4U0PWE5_9NEIS|nr:outer membrane protein assembly factor BamC [Chitiniphilus eburneus]TJZ72873.1 outer membrane protein assembly factor BamC [Chitiniphilus eburneus]